MLFYTGQGMYFPCAQELLEYTCPVWNTEYACPVWSPHLANLKVVFPPWLVAIYSNAAFSELFTAILLFLWYVTVSTPFNPIFISVSSGPVLFFNNYLQSSQKVWKHFLANY